jgi:anthranilate phosphoribosyltransferase
MLFEQVAKNIELGLSALRGQKGPAYDRIVLNAAMADHLLGCSGASDISCALERSKEAIDSGRALNRLLNYVEMSHHSKMIRCSDQNKICYCLILVSLFF